MKFNQAEKKRHSLYNFWRRNLQKISHSLSENATNCAGEDFKSENKNEVELPALNSEIKPLTSNASLPYPGTRSAVQQQLDFPTIIESSFILPPKQWKEIYDTATSEMKSG